MQASSTQRIDSYQSFACTGEQLCLRSATISNQNWNPNSSKQNFSTPGQAIKKITAGHDSAASTPKESPSSTPMTGTSSISSVSDNNMYGEQNTPRASAVSSTTSVREHILQGSDKASESDVSSRQSVSNGCSLQSASFALPTASSRSRTEKLNHPTPKPKDWKPSITLARSPRLRCVGKASTFSPTKDMDRSVKSRYPESSNRTKATSHSGKLLTPSAPKSPNVLRRKTFNPRRSARPEEPNRVFVPNPIPRYLKNENTLEIKQTRKSLQLAQTRLKTGRLSRDDPPKKAVTPVSLEPTSVKPFVLGSVAKHEEHIHQIQKRIAAEKDDDRKRREFRPVTLRPEILQGPTFVPKRSEAPLTRPVDLLPHAQERSERTLAFKARQRARIDELELHRRLAAEEREQREEGRLRKEYESKRFKSRPVPESHYTPDISPIGVEKKAHQDDETGASASFSSDCRETQLRTDSPDKSGFKKGKKAYEEVQDSVNDASSPTASENKATTILQGLRKSLSPLLGRGSISLS